MTRSGHSFGQLRRARGLLDRHARTCPPYGSESLHCQGSCLSFWQSAAMPSERWRASPSPATHSTRRESSAGSILQPSSFSVMFAAATSPPSSPPRTARAHASCSRASCSAPPPPQTPPASSSQPTAHAWPWSSAPCRSWAVNAWSASSGWCRDAPQTTRSAAPASHPPPGRGASSARTRMLDQTDRSRAPPQS